MTEAQMIKAMTRALSRLLAAIDAVEWRDKANLRLGPVVPEYENARAALDAIREHVMPSAALIERLTAERDALQAEKDQYEAPAWAANERLNEAVERLVEERDAALAREVEAFRAGAEAMREALRLAAIERAEWFEARHTAHASERGSALRYFLGEIKHTPLPAHQSTGDAT
jgi:hypothetical protein